MNFHAWADERKSNGMIYRTLGATGEKVSAIGLGGFHIGKPLLESTSIKIIRSAIDRGITFMDNCWDYHDGKSEIRMGKALRDGYRNKVFLMTKIDGRSKTGAAAQMWSSLGAPTKLSSGSCISMRPTSLRWSSAFHWMAKSTRFAAKSGTGMFPVSFAPR
jgi:aryl-alcohol dehydrogenase-like predicted oxidoreductase